MHILNVIFILTTIFFLAVFNLYTDQFYVAVIIHPLMGGDRSNQNSEIHLYSVNKDAGTTQKIHVLRTCFNGSLGLAMHAIDDVKTNPNLSVSSKLELLEQNYHRIFQN